MPVPDSVHLRQGHLVLDLCPALGGTITRFCYDDTPLMRPARMGFFEGGAAGQSSCYPLVPFSNRVADGRFRFQGRDYQLAPNFPPEPHAIHGQGWQHPWQVVAASAKRAELLFKHTVPDTPFTYRARQVFTLDERGVEILLEVSNRGQGPMPAGLGLHPYFPRTPGVRLEAALDHVWLADARKLPSERVPLPARWDFREPQAVDRLEMDNCFGGWNGSARIHWPEPQISLAIEAEPLFGHLVIYIPRGKPYFCVEPVSHVNDGFNMMARGAQDTGVQVLAPGETLAGRIRFRLA